MFNTTQFYISSRVYIYNIDLMEYILGNRSVWLQSSDNV